MLIENRVIDHLNFNISRDFKNFQKISIDFKRFYNLFEQSYFVLTFHDLIKIENLKIINNCLYNLKLIKKCFKTYYLSNKIYF